MAEAVGANLVGMGFIQLMPSSHPVTGALSGGLWTSAESQVFVNKEGRRFVDEDAERDVLAAAALKQPDGLFYIICDQVTAGNPQPGGMNGWGDDIDTLIETKSVYKADTLEDLAKQLGMSPSAPRFCATPRSPSVHHTMGGLEIDTLARVIDKNGKPIPGFYAAGEE